MLPTRQKKNLTLLWLTHLMGVRSTRDDRAVSMSRPPPTSVLRFLSCGHLFLQYNHAEPQEAGTDLKPAFQEFHLLYYYSLILV